MGFSWSLADDIRNLREFPVGKAADFSYWLKEYLTQFFRSFWIGYDDDENMQIDTNIDALQFKPDLPPPYIANEVLKVEGH